MTAEDQAKALGEEHRAAATTPFGSAHYVYWDAGSARLLNALGIRTATTQANHDERARIVSAYCQALTPGWRVVS